MGTESPLLGLKRLGHEADHSPQTTAEVKNMGGAIPLLPLYAMHRDNFTFFHTVLTSCTFTRQWQLSSICLTVDTLTVHTKVLIRQNIPQTVIDIKKLHHKTTKNDMNTLNLLIVGSCAVRYCIMCYAGTSSGQESTATTFSAYGGTTLNEYLNLQQLKSVLHT